MCLKLRIGGVQKSSLLDYPAKICAVVFTQGCNFRCGYCHNPNLVAKASNEPVYLSGGVLEFLKKRQGKLDAVVISGGEPTLQPDLEEFIRQIKDLGFLVKLDTNGSKSAVLKDLLVKNLLDYVAMDIKAPLHKYSEVAGVNINTEEIQESVNALLNGNVPCEFRTTVLKSQLAFEDFKEIAQLIKGAKKYYLQRFEPSQQILNPSLQNEKSYCDEEFEEILSILSPCVQNTEIR